jgi:FO synthase
MNYFGRLPPNETSNQRLPAAAAFELASAEGESLSPILQAASDMRDQRHGNVITYSKNVFIPLTHLCRNVCHYCTFAEVPDRHGPGFMSRDEVLAVARLAERAGCTEALLTLGDKPELRYAQARRELVELGHETTISYLTEIAELIMRETGLLPHVNPGVLDDAEIKSLREVSVSQGIMLESMSDRLCERGGPHYGSPDKNPTARLETIRLAGENKVPFTSGLLIGIGETRMERVDALLALRNLHDRFGHIQELIIQNFKPKPGTRMANHAEPHFEELLWTIAIARLLFGPEMNIQAPPNLLSGDLSRVIAAGINDWGGVSPVTPDFVNPEAPWPNVEILSKRTAECGKLLCERLAVYPGYALKAQEWLNEDVSGAMLKHSDSVGLARAGSWFAGGPLEEMSVNGDMSSPLIIKNGRLSDVLNGVMNGRALSHNDTIKLLTARGDEVDLVCQVANTLRADTCGDEVTYVINCNINYTNICTFRCAFCAFSKGKTQDAFRGKPYLRDIDEIVAMAAEAVAKGATEVCLQGGIHPSYTGETYIGITRAIHDAFPDLHIHAFSPLEVWHGAQTMGLTIGDYLRCLKDVGLKSLPGTAAEILDDEIRALICPDKLTTRLWLEIVEAAHNVGIPTTATVMFGHVEQPRHVANHLIHIRDLQSRTGGFTEFVPLPFVHMEAPISLKNRSRRGPTLREAVLVHAAARLVLHPHIINIQTSWVKMGLSGAKLCLNAGANDLGGTLMHESISRAAGAVHGQKFDDRKMRTFINSINRHPRQRTTDYGRSVIESCSGND